MGIVGIAKLANAGASVVMGLDTSTKAIAFSVFKDGELRHYGKVYIVGDTIYDKCGDANKKMYHLFKTFNPDVVLMEATVYVNNRQVVMKLGKIIGAVGGLAAALGCVTDDVAPMSWQNFIGNGNLSKTEKAELKKKNPKAKPAQLKKIGRELRKQRTMDIILDQFGVEIEDDDVADAIGIGYYGSESYGT